VNDRKKLRRRVEGGVARVPSSTEEVGFKVIIMEILSACKRWEWWGQFPRQLSVLANRMAPVMYWGLENRRGCNRKLGGNPGRYD
jgi:hypothetical protein